MGYHSDFLNLLEPQKPVLSQAEYIAAKGQVCPYCRSRKIQGEQVEIEDGRSYQPMSCDDCEVSWTDSYQLDAFSGPGTGE